MKNDYSFKLVAAIVFVGVIIAFASPSHAVSPADSAVPEAVQDVHQAE